MACLSVDQIARYVAGDAAAAETASVQEHVDSCESCRRGIATVVKSGRSGPAKSLGRYIVIDELGAGGMGVVYRAFDPELGRNVAVKLLHQASHVGEAHVRLVREARALAALSHPNVVTIHDIGTEADDVFIAMELVDGMTLRRWLAAQPRTPEAIADVLLQAGRGLAAAHAAGLVHRDFKPENVLVRADGRAQVSDFGLARSASDETDTMPLASSATTHATGSVVTRNGAVLGTLPYMAPEQVAGEIADARSDQFSFASVLVEALAGERPFRASSLAERRAAFERGDAPAGLGKLATRLRPVVRRALAVAPHARWSALDPVLAALGPAPSRRGRWLAVAIASAALVSGVAVFAATRDRGADCAHASSRLAGVWNPLRANVIAAAFERTGKPFAVATWQSTQKELDAYTTEWANTVIGACEDTHVRGDQSEALLDLRIACLDQRLASVDALAAVFEHPDGSVAENAAKAVQQLPLLAACNDKAALAQIVPPPTDPIVRGRVSAMRTRLAEAKAQRVAGQVASSGPLVDSIARDALALGYAPISAEALLLRGALEADRHQATAEATLSQAADLAEAGHDDATKAEAWLQRVRAATALAHYPEAHADAKHAAAVLERLGAGHEALVARLANYEGSTYMEEGDYEHALELQQRALALRDKLYNHDGSEVASSLNSIGNVEFNLSHMQKAVEAHTRALEIRTRVLGPHHPDVGSSHMNLSSTLESLGRFDEALEHLRAALAIFTEVFGATSKQGMQATGNLANLYKSMGRYEDAVVIAKEAIALAEATVGPKHPLTATQHYLLGESYLELAEFAKARPEIETCLAVRRAVFDPDHAEVLAAERLLGRLELQVGHLAQARKMLEDVLARQYKTLGPSHGDEAATESLIAYAMLQQREWKGAAAHFQRALEIDEGNLGLEHGDLVIDLVGIGNAKLEDRDPKGALVPLERAYVLCNKLTDVEPGARGDTQLALGRARWDAGGDRKAAYALVVAAKATFTKLGKAKESELRDANAWLAAHPQR